MHKPRIHTHLLPIIPFLLNKYAYRDFLVMVSRIIKEFLISPYFRKYIFRLSKIENMHFASSSLHIFKNKRFPILGVYPRNNPCFPYEKSLLLVKAQLVQVFAILSASYFSNGIFRIKFRMRNVVHIFSLIGL